MGTTVASEQEAIIRSTEAINEVMRFREFVHFNALMNLNFLKQ